MIAGYYPTAVRQLVAAAEAGAMVTLGAAILIGGSITALVGWASVAIGLLIVGGYLVFGDTLPAFVSFPTTIIGIALLLATG